MSQPPSLPKRRRNWGRIVAVVVIAPCLLLILSFLAWRWSVQHEVDRQLAAIRAAGLPTSGAELNDWYAPVPEAENAARVMAEAFKLWQTYPDARSNLAANFKLPPRGQSLSEEDKALLAGYVAMNAAALAKAHEAAALTKSRYPIDYTPGFDALLPHLGQVKRLAQLARLDAVLASDAGRATDATRALETILGCAQSLDSEPEVIGQLVRIAVLALAVDALEHGLRDGGFREAELARLAAAFATAEQTNRLARAFVGERAMCAPSFRRVGAGQGATTATTNTQDGSAWAPVPRSGVLLRTGIFDRDLAFYLTAMQTNISVAGAPPPRSLAAVALIEQQGQTAQKKFYILTGLFLPALAQAVVKEAGGIARLRLAQCALAIESFRFTQGRLPEDLSELVPRFLPAVPSDPFDGAPLRYRLLAKGYLLYSVDRDGQDNGGLEKPPGAKSTDKGSYDLGFLVER